ncbi:hypothetical protein [Marinobacter flavimaris]|jgi:hypothetical protein|uniref:hypothetical protein n=1 Tax=Marinobacter flavimaris TaxID=262076 RepID=UPI003870EAFA|tara:strand:+ start:20901 stop:21371 length:471 start_codon:yes stop_codon:yes gene_type:complete
MILDTLKAKLSAYAIPVIISLLGVAGLSFWWLWSDRQQLLEENAHLSQAMAQAKVTNEQNLSQIAQLQADIRWRDQQALIRSERERNLNEQLAQTEAELKELVKDAPCSGPEYVWPDAVYERMRAGTVADPNRVREGAGSSGLSGAENTSGATSAN